MRRGRRRRSDPCLRDHCLDCLLLLTSSELRVRVVRVLRSPDYVLISLYLNHRACPYYAVLLLATYPCWLIQEPKSLGADYKYGDSRHIFAYIDYCTSHMELRALAEKLRQVMPRDDIDKFFERGDEKRLAGILADLKVAHMKMQAWMWTVFELTVFASRGDIPLNEQLIWIPISLALIMRCTMMRALLWFPSKSLPFISRLWHFRR